MRSPCLLGRRHRPRHGVVNKVRVLSKASPQSKAFPSIVALVDQVAFSRVSAVVFLQGLGGALPGLGLEAAVFSHAQLDALAQAAEEGGLVGGRPAEPGRPAVAVDSAGPLSVVAGEVDVVLRHGGLRRDETRRDGRPRFGIGNRVGFRCPVRLDTDGHDPQQQPVKQQRRQRQQQRLSGSLWGASQDPFFLLSNERESGSAPGENRDLPHTGRWGESGRVPWRGLANAMQKKKGHVEVPFSPGSPSVSIARHVNAALHWTQKVAQEMEALKPQMDGCPSSCDALRWTGLDWIGTGLDWTGPLGPWACLGGRWLPCMDECMSMYPVLGTYKGLRRLHVRCCGLWQALIRRRDGPRGRDLPPRTPPVRRAGAGGRYRVPITRCPRR
ncbi:hypothetical protein J3F84DRAFT_189906 [Trichoderma pleuroticola]